MTQVEAKEILQNDLKDKYVVLDCFEERNNAFAFHVKEVKYIDDEDVWPKVFAVDKTSKQILDINEYFDRDPE